MIVRAQRGGGSCPSCSSHLFVRHGATFLPLHFPPQPPFSRSTHLSDSRGRSLRQPSTCPSIADRMRRGSQHTCAPAGVCCRALSHPPWTSPAPTAKPSNS